MHKGGSQLAIAKNHFDRDILAIFDWLVISTKMH
jgi:hypothetical protein